MSFISRKKSSKVAPVICTETNVKSGDPSCELIHKIRRSASDNVGRLTSQWQQIEGNLTEYRDKGWKQFIEKVEHNDEIHKFRETLDIFLKEICSIQLAHDTYCASSCLSSGSMELTSDIDITVKGNCLAKNFFHLEALRKTISLIFSKSYFFTDDNGIFDINSVFRFFDINFYISNFAIKKKPIVPEDRLSSYWVSDSYNQLRVIKEQSSLFGINKSQMDTQEIYDRYKMVILELDNYILKVAQRTDDFSIFGQCNTTRNSTSGILESKTNLQDAFDSNNEREIANAVVDTISQLATMEDECYVSQGAFFHVVMSMQRGLIFKDVEENAEMKKIYMFMMVCSILENLRFAVHHPGKSRGKYLIRVFDANIIRDPSGQDQLSKSMSKLLQRSDVDINDIKKLQQLRRSKDDKVTFISLEKEVKEKFALLDEGTLERKFEELYEHVTTSMYQNNVFCSTSQGGKMKLKPLLGKDKKQIKKHVDGKMRLIFIDSKRRQYTKRKDGIVPLRK